MAWRNPVWNPHHLYWKTVRPSTLEYSLYTEEKNAREWAELSGDEVVAPCDDRDMFFLCNNCLRQAEEGEWVHDAKKCQCIFMPKIKPEEVHLKPLTLVPAAPPAVIKAMEHVRATYPEVNSVVYDLEGRWLYGNTDGTSPIFDGDVDVAVLEDGVDALKALPAVFYVVEDQ